MTTKSDKAKLVMKYVEAVTGSTFVVKLNVEPCFSFKDADYLGWRISVDGKFLAGPLFKRSTLQRQRKALKHGAAKDLRLALNMYCISSS